MKPILFNTEMVRAILNGQKTATRRIIKPQPKHVHTILGPSDEEDWTFDFLCGCIENGVCLDWIETVKMPYQPGDILYVRETWNKVKLESESEWHYEYRASCENPSYFSNGFMAEWRPSIHMPKEAARIFLRVTDIRVERLQEMPHDAPKKEGIHYCECPDGFTWNSHTTMQDCYINPMGAMKALWNSTVKKSDLEIYGWDANPWVWVIEFERIIREKATLEEITL